MAFITTSRKFYDAFTGMSGGGVPYLNSNQGDKVTCVLEGYFYWASTNRHLLFDTTKKTISAYFDPASLVRTDTESFINDGFNVGDTFDVAGSASNDGGYTISAISDGVITTVETLVTEDCGSCALYGTTLITAMDFYYNLIENTSTTDFLSKTDAGTLQRYTANGLDANVATPVYAIVGTDSFAWVTDVLTGDVSQVKIEGQNIVDYRQQYKITQTFRQTVIWQTELLTNFANRSAPSDFINGKRLKHIFRVDGKFDYNDPQVAHTGIVDNINGFSAWYNQSSIQGRPEYSCTSVAYQNNVTSDFIPNINASIVTKVSMVINSRNGKFVNGTSPFILSHFLCPLETVDYINTSTTLLQNIKQDEQYVVSDQTAVNGINYGTNYQSLTNIQIINVSATQCIVTFLVDYSTEIKNYLKTKKDDNRYYSIVISCQDVAITTTKGVDRVNVICDFNIADFDFREANNFGLIDYIHCYQYPNSGVYETNSVGGYEGDPSYVQIPFWLESAVINNISPTLQDLTIQIVSTKSGENDFVFEEKVFDLSSKRKLNDKQSLNAITSRGFILPENSPFNEANIVRYSDVDDGTKIGYKVQYGFVLRYETWRQAIESAAGNQYDIFKYFENVNEAWAQYSQGNGWSLKIRMNASVKGYDSFITKYTTQTDIVIYDQNANPDEGTNFAKSITYYNDQDVEVPFILTDQKTRIIVKYVGDVAIFPTGFSTYYGYIFIDDSINGGIYNRRFAGTDLDSEKDSPFSTIDLPSNGAIFSYKSNALRLSLFQNRIELDTIIDRSFTNAGAVGSNPPLIKSKLGHNGANIILQENGYAILQENGDYILL